MSEVAPFVDASVFLGMHHEDESIRMQSLSFFRSQFPTKVQMNYEQIGICDAVIWLHTSEVQTLYYPFMDRLHSVMRIERRGYTFPEINLALSHPELVGFRPEQALLVGQVLYHNAKLATHDTQLRALPFLETYLWDFDDEDPQQRFSPELEELYEQSRSFVYKRD